LMIDECVTR